MVLSNGFRVCVVHIYSGSGMSDTETCGLGEAANNAQMVDTGGLHDGLNHDERMAYGSYN